MCVRQLRGQEGGLQARGHRARKSQRTRLPSWEPVDRCCWESCELPGQSLGLDSGAGREDHPEKLGSGEEGHWQG